ncbi:MAG: tetratricopeptide repeat protein [Thermoanaerobaculia bacterium]
MTRGRGVPSRWLAIAALAVCLPWPPATLQAAKKPPAGDPSAASALIDKGEPTKAVKLLDRWIKKHPKDHDALLLRSTARFMLGEIEEGRRDLERAIELFPQNRQAWLNKAALALANEQYPDALDAFERAEALDPQADDNSLNLGAALLLLDRFDEAGARFRDYLKRNPGDPRARYLVASNYAMRAFSGPAVANLKRAIALDEKMRRNARADPNFAPLEGSPAYQELLDTDSFRPPSGSRTRTERFDEPFFPGRSLVLDSVISALQLAGRPFDPQVEVAASWALVWSDLRIKVADDGRGGTRLELSAPPGRFSADQWQAVTTELLRSVTVQLHTRSRRAPDSGP